MNENWGHHYHNLGKSYEKWAIFRGGGREKLPKNLGQINRISGKSIVTPKLLIDLFGKNPMVLGRKFSPAPLSKNETALPFEWDEKNKLTLVFLAIAGLLKKIG
ncbi:MAG: hypothetical protein F6K22_00625 [Okeania sp. SIO2F4]|uniref:hypothetical protein n=1 Tax=unclassified Okeania TaxID=2634635 RepID=UPI0013BBEEE8|nr:MULTISPECIES: hypothetical protein [unclassified Okeania]NEP70936.1 hypothetical protein [Okeania sp. SIO2G5]NEP92284.1 hypothetical protein [Okeania sp. SIO2F5]NEQ89988.1 hypothetical protein [Okeania sp. SIO2G4]NES01477.1 hypothetical protein [Okeania sp. SIO2F4]